MSSPEVWRMITGGVTRTFEAKKVAEFSNPGDVFEFHGQLYRVKEGKLVHCSLEETVEGRKMIMARVVEDEAREGEEREFRAKRAKALGW